MPVIIRISRTYKAYKFKLLDPKKFEIWVDLDNIKWSFVDIMLYVKQFSAYKPTTPNKIITTFSITTQNVDAHFWKSASS